MEQTIDDHQRYEKPLNILEKSFRKNSLEKMSERDEMLPTKFHINDKLTDEEIEKLERQLNEDYNFFENI